MTKDQGMYEYTVPDDDPSDTSPELKDTTVIVDLRFRDGTQVIGWKQYINRDLWVNADRDARALLLIEIAGHLMESMDSPERDQ